MTIWGWREDFEVGRGWGGGRVFGVFGVNGMMKMISGGGMLSRQLPVCPFAHNLKKM